MGMYTAMVKKDLSIYLFLYISFAFLYPILLAIQRVVHFSIDYSYEASAQFCSICLFFYIQNL